MSRKFSSDEIAKWMTRAGDPTQRFEISKDPGCPPEVLFWLIQNMSDFEYAYFSTNPSLPEEAIEYILRNSQNTHQKIETIDLPNFNSRLMDILSVDPDSYTRAEAVRFSSEARLAVFASDPEEQVRAVVAENPYTPLEILLKLVDDESSEVLVGLTLNEAQHDEVWQALFKKTASVLNPVNYSIAQNAPAKFIEQARQTLSPPEHHMFLYNPNMPKEWLDEFLAEPRYNLELFANVLVNSNLVQNHHLAKLISSNNIRLRESIAKRPHLPKNIQEILVKDKSASVRAAFAENPYADVSILELLLKDKSVTVIERLKSETYWDIEKRAQVKYSGRESLILAANGSSKKLSEAGKFKSVAGKSEALQSEILDMSEYLKLLEDKSIGIRTAATLRAAELGLITFKEAASFITKNAPQTTAPKNRWIESRLQLFKSEANEAYLDLILELKGDDVLSQLFLQKENALSESQILKIAKAHLPITNWNLARTLPMSADLLDEIAETPSFSYDTFGYPEGELEFGQWAGETTSGYRVASYPQALAAINPTTRIETLEKLKKSKSKYVRGVVFLRPEVTSIADVEKAAKDKEAFIRTLVAQHPLVTLEILEKLASDKDPEVRASACSHKLATKEMKAAAALLK